MKVQVHLYGEFQKSAGLRDLCLEMEEKSTADDIFKKLRLPKTIYKMFLVNGIRVNDDWPVKDGDEVHIFQPVGGG